MDDFEYSLPWFQGLVEMTYSKWAYYNENDPQKCAWLRELLKQNVIAPGEVDERSIAEVQADDIRGFAQCHFFAGIGVWSYALRLAGWPDTRSVWTGSCPCPSFSCAGKGKGFDDPRHLWPHWDRLIEVCCPAVIFGEQVDDAIGHGWLDVVYVALEAKAYSVGAAVLGACSVGAPHIRQRLYFCAQSMHAERRPLDFDGQDGRNGPDSRWSQAHGKSGAHGEVRTPANTAGPRRQGARKHGSGPPLFPARSEQCSSALFGPHAERDRRYHGRRTSEKCASANGRNHAPERTAILPKAEGLCLTVGGATDSKGLEVWVRSPEFQTAGLPAERRGPTGGFWADCDWWYGRDGKWRPIESGVQPLAVRTPNRVLKLRGYGDAIVAPLAKEFIEAAREAIDA